MLQKLYDSNIKFNHKLWVMGFGAIGPALIYMFLKICKTKPEDITIIDLDCKVKEKINKVNKNMNFVNKLITHNNYKEIFKNVEKDDIIIDCSYNVCTTDMYIFCQEVGCSYINSSIEEWSYKDVTDPFQYSLLYKHLELDKLNKTYSEHNTNFIISMGCNPGNVSIWAKFGIVMLNEKFNKANMIKNYKTYGELAHKLGIKVIHISEKDTQKTKNPKKINEYCNTWSSTLESMYEEAMGPVEVSWGTHEKTIPSDKVTNPHEQHNLLILQRRGMSTYATSYVPLSKNYIGMVVRHDEAFTMGREFSYYEGDKLISKPTVYYVYHPCDSTMQSFHELRERNLEYQDNTRLLTSDIISGRDELGVTFYLENGDIYWIGSLLGIDEAREIYDNKFDDNINATIVQVIGGYMSGLLHIIENINKKEYKGLLCPDDLPYGKMLNASMPFFGEFLMMKVNDWKYSEKYNNIFGESHKIDPKNNLQFDDFVVNY